jgi:predicted nucleic acid-binding protein
VFLLDTNVLSEALKPAPAPSVIKWLDQNFSDCAISSLAIFELGAGVALLESGRRRNILEVAIARIIRRFGSRVYAFDTPAAQSAARLLAHARAQGLGLHQIPAKLVDLQIAGIATAYRLAVATRNIGDFQGLGLALVNPWHESTSTTR